jgi:hypothetical protein
MGEKQRKEAEMKQRDLFYGEKKKSRKRSRKKSKKVLPVCRRRGGKVEADEIKVSFNNSTATGYGGYPITRRFFKWVQLNRYFAQHIHIRKRSNGYTIPEIGSYLIDSKVLGLERLMHVEVLRYDPLLTKSYGIASLPAGKTLGDYLKSYDVEKNESLERMNTRMNKDVSRRVVGNKLQGVIVDYDSSTMTVYGKQEGADRGRSFRKKDKPGFQPKFAFIGGLDVMVNQQLYPESYNLQKEFMPFHQATLKKIPDTMKVVGVRGDTAIFSQANIKYFEEEGYTYGISAPMNGPLREAVWQIEEEGWVECQDEKGRIMSVARIEYKPKTWKGEKKYTFIISRRLRSHPKQEVLFPQDKYKFFAYITNKRGTIVEQFTFCVERCSLERCIKETKLGFDIDSLPCTGYEANRAYLGHVQLAYNLAIFFKLSLLPRGVNRWTIDTIRRRLIAIPGNLIHKSSGWVLSLPKWWPYKDIFRYAERRLLSLQPG